MARSRAFSLREIIHNNNIEATCIERAKKAADNMRVIVEGGQVANLPKLQDVWNNNSVEPTAQNINPLVAALAVVEMAELIVAFANNVDPARRKQEWKDHIRRAAYLTNVLLRIIEPNPLLKSPCQDCMRCMFCALTSTSGRITPVEEWSIDQNTIGRYIFQRSQEISRGIDLVCGAQGKQRQQGNTQLAKGWGNANGRFVSQRYKEVYGDIGLLQGTLQK